MSIQDLLIKYKDDKFDNKQEILFNINHLIDDNLLCYIRLKIPDIIIQELEEFSTERKQFKKTWENVCRTLNVKQKKIILLDIDSLNLIDNKAKAEDYQICINICERLTKLGYHVRGADKLIGCMRCNKVILTESMYNFCKENKLEIKLSKIYNPYCKECLRI